MTSTNASKIQDPEKQALAFLLSTTSSRPRNKDHPTLLPDTVHPSPPPPPPPPKMSRIQHIFLCCVLLAIFSFTMAAAVGNLAPKSVSLEEKLRFQELLDSVDSAALHEVLHEHLNDKYQHGVYREDKIALEVVHETDADAAQSLVELAKRQSNTTVTSTTQTTTSTSDTSTSQVQVTPSTSTQTTTTQQPTPTVTTTTSQTTQVATPTPSRATTTASATSRTTVASTLTTTQLSSTHGSSSISTSSASSTTASTDTTGSPAASRSVTQQIVYTTTLANGAPTTVTSVTVVPADQAGNTAGGATKTNPNASLQTNGGKSGNQVGWTGVLGAIGVVVVGAL